MATQTLQITGMRCASCVNHVEKNLQAVPGVQQVSVNLATEEATVEHDTDVQLQQLVDAVKSAGYAVDESKLPSQADKHGPQYEHHQDEAGHQHDHGEPEAESKAWRWRLIGCGVLAVVVAVLGMTWHGQVSAWVQLVLAVPVQVVLGWPFYRGAVRAGRHLRADMDTLVALGTSVAFGYSAVVTIMGGSEVYFDTAVVILLLIGVGKWMEARARGSAASAIRGLMDLQPVEATVLRDGEEKTLPVSEVTQGDRILVRPGQRVPVDGEVYEGSSTLDQSMVTGESMPVEVASGDQVYAGTVNQAGSFRFTATATGSSTLLAQVVELVKKAQASKASIQRIADRVAGVFVPVVLVIAVLSLLGWGVFSGDWVFAMVTCVAVLIVACPCALGLATPTAIMVGTGIGAKHGILIKDARALERAGRLTDIILDKTGTLTQGKPTVSDVVPAEQDLDGGGILRLAAAVEAQSEHPLGQAIVEHAKSEGIDLPQASDFQSITGGGVRGSVGQHQILVGKPAVLESNNIDIPKNVQQQLEQLQAQAKTVVTVAVDGRCRGLIALADQPRDGAGEAVASLHELGLNAVLMTGDNHATAQAVAKEMNIDDVMAEVLPTDKQAKVEALQQQGKIVAMVGDGINDAPALASADIGIAMGGGTDIAMEAGHVVLVGSELANLPRAIRLSKATMRRIYFGLFWAFAYNVVLIPVAVAGWLDPMLAAGAMAFSSVSVVLNALYLRWSWHG